MNAQQPISRVAAQEIEAAKVLLAQLGDLLTDDDELLRDTLEGQTNLVEVVRTVVMAIGEDEARVEGLAAYKKALDARKARLEQRIECLRGLALSALDLMGEKRREFDLATITAAPVASKVEVTEESEIPARFWVDQAPKLDRKALLAALKAKETIPGAVLSNGSVTLKISWR